MIDTKELRQSLGAVSPEEVEELLNRLEAAERVHDALRDELKEVRYGAAVAHDTIKALRTKISDLTVNVEYLGNLKTSYEELIGELQDERDALRAKIEQMEKQEPVGRALLCVRCSTPFDGEHYCPACGHHTATEEAVYAIPGAQPAPSISPTALRPVIQWLRNGCDPVRAADELEMLAAAPEAKP